MPSPLPAGWTPALARLYASPHFVLALAPLFWAANWIVGRGLRENPPFTMAWVRWAFALAIMLPFCWQHFQRGWPLIRRHWRWIVPVSMLGAGIGNVLTYIGLKYTTAINGAFLNSFVPIMIILLLRVFLDIRLGRVQLLGVAVSFVGVIVLMIRGNLEILLSLRLNPGDLILLCSLLLWSVYTIMLRGRPAQLHPMALLLVIAAMAVGVLTPFALTEFALGHRLDPSLDTIGALAFVGLFSSFLAYVLYNRGVEQAGAHIAGLYTHLMPVYGMLLAMLFLDERLRLFHAVGFVLILTGIWIASRGPARPSPERDAPTESPG